MRFATTIGGVFVAGLIAATLPAAVSVAQQSPEPASSDAPRPGQTPEVAAPGTPLGVDIGVIHWFPAEPHCRFFTPERREAFVAEDPESWQFVFLTMLQDGDGSDGPLLERGYVMANGLLREMEKARAAPDSNGNIVTVWRSAGEPRINVNMTLVETEKSAERTVHGGSMTLFWGDKKSTIEVVGDCVTQPPA